jgi:transposase
VAWRAVSLDQLVVADHRVRLVWRFVEGLDLAPLYAAIKAIEGRPGHPPADPQLLVALWLYATLEGIGSARTLARLCAQHLAYQWLCGGVGINHKTLSDFRVGHGAVLEGLLVDSFAALLRTGVASLERVAQDGVRVRAAAGAASFRRHTSLQACQERAQEVLMGQVVAHKRMCNGAIFLQTGNGNELTEAEWEEYCAITTRRTKHATH